MKKLHYIFEEGDHRWAVIARDPERQNYLIDTNEYLVMNGDEMLLTDPGGKDISFGKGHLEFVPAHYLHSSGNFHLYDPGAKMLFSGDIGAALLPPTMDDLYVVDFDEHIKHAELFHKRWMGSNKAKNDWCQRVSDKRIDMLCPQHGAIYRGANVERFINWFAELKVGVLGN
ncbi:MAG: MBL fold metallo-hydrolase [Gammaproteobacteria bacterium]|nr:MBL fold metallo-hydrolase [Gammaproteobacteria bacterium]